MRQRDDVHAAYLPRVFSGTILRSRVPEGAKAARLPYWLRYNKNGNLLRNGHGP